MTDTETRAAKRITRQDLYTIRSPPIIKMVPNQEVGFVFHFYVAQYYSIFEAASSCGERLDVQNSTARRNFEYIAMD